MENKEEDETRNRWRITELLDEDPDESTEPSNKKRKVTKRITTSDTSQVVSLEDNGVSTAGSKKRKGALTSFLVG